MEQPVAQCLGLGVGRVAAEKQQLSPGDEAEWTARFDAAARPALPETVSVAREEIATDMREGLLAAVGTGLHVMAQLMQSRRGRSVRPERANTIPARRPYAMAARPTR